MALSQAERQRRATRDFAEKLQLEARLAERWRRLQNRLARTLAVAVGQGAALPNLAAITIEEGTPILRDHYATVEARFREPDDESLSEELAAALGGILATLWGVRAREQAERIAGTDQEDAAAAVRVAEAERERFAAEEGEILPRASVAAMAGVAFERRLRARIPAISGLETQAPAEQTKAAAARLAGAEPFLPGPDEGSPDERRQTARRVALGTTSLGAVAAAAAFRRGEPVDEVPAGPTKSWVSMGDSRVRPHHMAADVDPQNEGVPVDEPFIVRGERLMYPGDSSLGASLDNVVNCRCSAVYDFEP